MRHIALLVILAATALLLAGCSAANYIERGDEAMADNRAADAAKNYQQALDRKHELAQDADFMAKLKHARCLAAFQDGQALAARRDWDRAAARFAESLAIDPAFNDAAQGLANARARRAEAEDHFTRAVAAARDGKWEDAIAAADAALAVFPQHAGATALAADARRRVAAGHVDAGRALAAQGNLAEAEKRFRQALAVVPNQPEALDGLAQADFTRGQADERLSRWGGAMLWYMDAADHVGGRRYADYAAAAQARVKARVAFSLGLDDTPVDRVAAPAAALLRGRVLKALDAARPEFVRLVDLRTANPPAAYAAAVRMTGVNIEQRPISVERRVHPYTIASEIPNPAVAHLRHAHAEARDDLARMKAEYATPCPACAGAGRVTCPTCGGVNPRTCTKCGGTGRIACPRCAGRGRLTTITPKDIARLEAEVAQLRHDADSLPPTVIERIPAAWQYSVETYEKAGWLTADFHVRRAAGGEIIKADTARIDLRFPASTVMNANPAIGLAPQPLRLPPDAEVQQALADRAAADVAARILGAATQDFAGQVAAAVERLSTGGSAADALEASVDLATVLRPANPAEADRIIADLRAQRRTP